MAEKLDRFRRMSGGPNPNKRITVLEKAMEETLLDVETLETAVGTPLAEGDGYSGGIDNGILYNDGNTFATNSGFIYDQLNQKAYIENIDVEDKFRIKNSGVDALRAYSAGSWISMVIPASYTAQVEGGNWSFGSWNSNPDARLNINLGTDQIGQKIDLSNGQTADAFQINSYGNTGGDLFRVQSSGAINALASSFSIYEFKAPTGVTFRIAADVRHLQFDVTNTQMSMYTSGSQPLLLGTVGTERMRIDATGNVGIGTTNPSAKLQVKGSGTTSATTALLVEDSLGTDLLKVTGEGSFYINGSRTFTNSNNNSQLTFNNAFTDDNAANNTSFALVDIDYTWDEKYSMSGAYVNDIRITPNFDGQVSGNQDLSKYVSIYIKPTFASNLRNVTYKGIYLDTPTFNQIVPETYHPLYITSGNSYFGGNVGIGTTSPDAKLHTNLSSDVVGHRLDLSNGQTADAFQINSYGNTGGNLFRIAPSGQTFAAATVSGTSNDILEYAYTSTSGYNAGRFAFSQNYGRATISINSGASNASIGLQGSSLQIGTQNVGSMDFSTRYFGFQTSLSGGYYNFKDNNGDSILYLDNDTKNIGIGTTSPDASSILDLTSTTQGVLLPRMTTTQRDAIVSPATGLSIFNTSTSQPEYYSGTAWEGAAGGGISIGDSIGGASVSQVLFTDVSGLLAQNSKFVFDGSTLNFTGASSSNTTNSSFGVNAGNSNSGTGNTSIGNSANNNSTGNGLTSVGNASGVQAVSDFSVYIGDNSGYQSSGNRNVFAGYLSGRQNNGQNSVGIGDTALFSTTGNQNTAIGSNSLSSGSGSGHVALGYGSLLYGTGNNNVAVGYYAGFNQTGTRVLAIGYQAGQNNTQNNRVIIGQTNLPKFTGATVADADAAAAAALPAASANGVYLYWNAVDNTIKARP